MITVQEIQRLAELARIELSADEAAAFTTEFDSILGYIGQIQKTTGDIEAELPPLRNVMRDDVVTHAAGQYTEAILDNAPAREGAYLKVKKIL